MTVNKYNVVSRILHWVVAALVVVQFGIAWTMPEVERGTQPVGLIAWHLSIGTAILAVMLLRLIWRLSSSSGLRRHCAADAEARASGVLRMPIDRPA
jgi:cytochrome b561